MTEGSIARQIFFFSVPLILGNLLQQLYNTADSIIVGNYVGSNALAAVGALGVLNAAVVRCVHDRARARAEKVPDLHALHVFAHLDAAQALHALVVFANERRGIIHRLVTQLFGEVRAYLSRFNFSGGDQEKLCGVLSGGERNRLHLAMALKEEGNVLLLDEPTNDIDVNTLRALEEGLEDFAGCAVIISHDRWFLDRICTHILAFEGDSNVFYFEGSYSEYEENKQKRLGKEEPTRVRYRKLMND